MTACREVNPHQDIAR